MNLPTRPAFNGISRPADSPEGGQAVQRRSPRQRWHLAPAQPQQAAQIAASTALSPLLAQVLINRGIETLTQAQHFLNPDLETLPSPLEEFPALAAALELLAEAIAQRHKIAICGDYDADGMTSTALLIRALRFLGAEVDYAIPSRMSEGYGINSRIVEEFHADGVRLILTVDNGIAAVEPIARARELGLTVIVTDHHDVPPVLPPAQAILNPKLIAPDSPYYGLAGVGVAYILALELAQHLGRGRELERPLLELFTLGTIADLAPLVGVNRRWVRKGLSLLPHSQIEGVRALIQVAGLAGEKKPLKPEAIGFRLGPRINAVGRISNPEIVIDLLTTGDPGFALERAMACEQVNQCRQQLCELIEKEAIAWIETQRPNLQEDRVLVVVQPGWHHGVIGIVASRLVERYGVPVFIGTYEDDPQFIRGSARSIPEFHIFEALQFCKDTLEKFGGHRAAGGFSLRTENLEEFCLRLQLFANMYLLPEHLKPLVVVDAQASFDQIDLDLYHQIDALHPCGIGNPDPVFWTPDVRVLEQKTVGRDRAHLKLTLGQEVTVNGRVKTVKMKAIAWRWGEFCPLPERIDVAYQIRLNDWNGSQRVELEVVGARRPQSDLAAPSQSAAMGVLAQACRPVNFEYAQRQYLCGVCQIDGERELRIRNPEGKVLALQPSQRRGFIGESRDSAEEVDICQPHYFNLIRAALGAVETFRRRRSPQS